VALTEPLAHPPIGDAAVGLMRRYFFENLNVDGTGAVIASPGSCPALVLACNGGCVEGYHFHWERDGGLSMATLGRLLGSPIATAGEREAFTEEVVRETQRSFAGWVSRIHERVKFDGVDQAEPKINISTEIAELQWCRPQTDGPPLRAQALMIAARNEPDIILRNKLWNLVRFDLDWLANETNIKNASCDIWEENRESNFFWNRMVMRSALLMGYEFAMDHSDPLRANKYLQTAQEFLQDPDIQHFQKRDETGCFFAQCPPNDAGPTCHDKGKSVDGAVILGLIHSDRSVDLKPSTRQKLRPLAAPTSEAVARTVETYNEVFCQLYHINRKDTEEGIPGVLYGRYIKDLYGGDGLGNPWVLITAALASLFYQAAQASANGEPPSPEAILRWRLALQSDNFNGTVKDFVAAGDSVLLRIAKHVEVNNWHLYEQIDKVTGLQYNAKDLTWSYAEVLSAMLERSKVWPESLQQVDGEGATQAEVPAPTTCADSQWPSSVDLNPSDLLKSLNKEMALWKRILLGLLVCCGVCGCLIAIVWWTWGNRTGSALVNSDSEQYSSSDEEDAFTPGGRG